MHPYPANVIPLHRCGNKIPVAGSFEGESMIGSLPNGAAEHCAIEVSALLLVVFSVNSSVVARRRDADEMGKAFGTVDGLGLV